MAKHLNSHPLQPLPQDNVCFSLGVDPVVHVVVADVEPPVGGEAGDVEEHADARGEAQARDGHAQPLRPLH